MLYWFRIHTSVLYWFRIHTSVLYWFEPHQNLFGVGGCVGGCFIADTLKDCGAEIDGEITVENIHAKADEVFIQASKTKDAMSVYHLEPDTLGVVKRSVSSKFTYFFLASFLR